MGRFGETVVQISGGLRLEEGIHLGDNVALREHGFARGLVVGVLQQFLQSAALRPQQGKVLFGLLQHVTQLVKRTDLIASLLFVKCIVHCKIHLIRSPYN